MRILLDTNAFLWQVGLVNGTKLGPKTKKLLLDAEVVYVSVITIIEMHIKTMIGKLDAPVSCRNVVLEAGNELLALSPQAADAVRGFAKLARHDPFDRMLLAQAKAESLVFFTADESLLELNLHFVVDARK